MSDDLPSAPTGSTAWWVPGGPRASTGTSPDDLTVVLPAMDPQTAELPVVEGGLVGTDGSGGGRPKPSRWAGLRFPATVGFGVLMIVVAVGLLLHSLRGGQAGGAGPRAGASPAVATLAAARIDAHATSTQKRAGDVTYDIRNTLDGDPATAWNSNGQRARGVGIVLVYTFDAPVDLATITVRNGYQKVLPRAGGPDLDLYQANKRVRRFRVITDAGRWNWGLKDVRDAQTFTAAAGRTRTVTLVVTAVYAGDQFPDLAISDIAFAVRAG